jgi:hypothetical protein
MLLKILTHLKFNIGISGSVSVVGALFIVVMSIVSKYERTFHETTGG